MHTYWRGGVARGSAGSPHLAHTSRGEKKRGGLRAHRTSLSPRPITLISLWCSGSLSPRVLALFGGGRGPTERLQLSTQSNAQHGGPATSGEFCLACSSKARPNGETCISNQVQIHNRPEPTRDRPETSKSRPETNRHRPEPTPEPTRDRPEPTRGRAKPSRADQEPTRTD